MIWMASRFIRSPSPTMTRTAHATVNDRESRLRHSLKRLGYELVDADGGQYYIRHQGSTVHATADLFGLSLDQVETWIRDRRTGYDQQ